VFVLPSETIGPVAAETVILECAASAPYEVRGTLADWRAGVGALASGHVLPQLAISAAIAGPLLALAGGEGGGVHFHGLSSKGKTTILQAAASVWGRGASDGYVRTWRATANGLEGGAALATDTALVLDEMGVLDSREAAAAIYALANGGGKQRAGRDGALREPKSWRVGRNSLRGEIDGRQKQGARGADDPVAGHSGRSRARLRRFRQRWRDGRREQAGGGDQERRERGLWNRRP
jgi:putative DNA primase/helicase